MRSLIVLLLSTSSALAQVWSCQTYDTTALSAQASSVITSCQVNTGHYDQLLAASVGQLTCNSGSTASVSMVSTTIKRPTGASFMGQVGSGILTVSSMITPFPTFGIDIGDILSDGNSGTKIPVVGTLGSTLTVTGQLTGTTSGVGTYTVSPASVTVASEQMWALFNYPLKPPSSNSMVRVLQHTSCTNGNNYISPVIGGSDHLFVNNTSIYVWPTITCEANPSVKSCSWQNGQITATAITSFIAGGGTGGIVQ